MIIRRRNGRNILLLNQGDRNIILDNNINNTEKLFLNEGICKKKKELIRNNLKREYIENEM